MSVDVKKLSQSMIRIENQYYVLASSPLLEVRTRVLKDGDTFAVFDRYGDIHPIGLGEQGIYHEDTRYLSRLMLTINGERPLLLSSTVNTDNALFTVDLTNPDIHEHGEILLPHSSLHIFRTKFLWEGSCYERLRILNYSQKQAELSIALQFEADCADLFEVRGVSRARRGEYLKPRIRKDSVVLAYQGLDGLRRRTFLSFTPVPHEISESRASFDLKIEPRCEALVMATMSFEGSQEPRIISYDRAYKESTRSFREDESRGCRIQTSNQQFNSCINRTVVDLHMMITRTPQGPYPYAGVPWFSTPFGRDGIITAWECLAFNPSMAKGVLNYLASTQATSIDDERDAQPGKILHETRKGEMAALKEVPFGLYYGSVDSTPLFIMLAGEYYDYTGDRQLIENIWPNLMAAMDWIDTYGDIDGDGFVEYMRNSPRGLVQQGWKDSHDSIFHSDGSFAEGPIALCEVQGYVYAARKKAARLAVLLGHNDVAMVWHRRADDLYEKFQSAFWCEDINTYALALDGAKRPCRVRTSNAGHTLFTGIAEPQKAARVAQTLFSPEMYSGWGIRTLGMQEVRYNPMSYHNGSIWPHDNALIAQGLANYFLKDQVLLLCRALYEATAHLDLNRLPELFCGFIRRPSEGPTLYPVACAPQSWSAAAILLLIQSCLGLTIKAEEERVYFNRPLLPEFLNSIRIKNLKVGSAGMVDLELDRYESGVGIKVLKRERNVQVVTLK